MENPYLPPKSDMSIQERHEEPDTYAAKRSMLIAMSIIAGVDTVAALYSCFVENKYSLLYTLTSCIILFVLCWYLMVVINWMANGHGVNGRVRKFGIWSFLWRAYVTKWISMIPTLLFMVLFYSGGKITPSIPVLIASSTFMALVSPLIVLALFSNNRRAQLLWISTVLARI